MPTAATDRSVSVLARRPLPVAPPIARPAAAGGLVRVRVWDLPTRAFHWSLVAALLGLAVTGYAGGAWIDWHARLGTLVLALLAWRVLWGFVGGRWSRFAQFLPTPGRLRRYLRGEGGAEAETGHSPLGALSVLAMLAVLLLQVASGLVSDDGAGFTGPLNDYVSSASGLLATLLHKQVGQWVLLALVLLHVAAIAWYRIARGRRLVRAMVEGDKLLENAVPPSRDDAASRMFAAALFLSCLLVTTGALGR